MLHSLNRHWGLIVLLVLIALPGQAQDEHFSQQLSAPVRSNPAFTGLFEGQIRLTVTYRNQWKNIGADFNTGYFGMDFKVIEIAGGSLINFGFHFTRDQAGDLNLSRQSGKLSVALTQPLDRRGNHFIGLGFSYGMLSHSINFANMEAFDSEPLAQQVRLERTNSDMSIGFLWNLYLDRTDTRLYFAAAAHHLSTASLSVSEQIDEAIDSGLKRRIEISAGAEIAVGDFYQIVPSVRLHLQKPHQEVITGAMLKWNNGSDWGHFGIGVGAWARWNSKAKSDQIDALILAVRLENNRMAATFSYDLNISSLSAASNGFGGPEITLSGAFGWKKSPKIHCPRL